MKLHCPENANLPKAGMKFVNPEVGDSATKYLKKIKIGDIDDIEALIDTGSSDCVMKASLVLDKDFNFIRAPNTLVGFGKTGNEVRSSGIINETVKVDECLAENIIFLVVPDNLQSL